MTEDNKEYPINIYDDESEHINILDQGVVALTESELQNVIDLAIEIAYRAKHDVPYEKFLEKLADDLEQSGVF